MNQDTFVVTPVGDYLSRLTDESAMRLESSLGSAKEGRTLDLVTPIIGRSSDNYAERRAYFRDWLLPKTRTRFEELNNAELNQSEKMGPYSIQLPWHERRDNLLAYYSRGDISIDYARLQEAIDVVSTRLPSQLVPKTTLTAYHHMPKNTNLGAPWFTSNKEYLPLVLRKAQEVERRGFPNLGDPCIVFWRGQPTGLGTVPKQRTIWGYPHYITIHELRLQMAFFEWAVNDEVFSAWVSSDAVDKVITNVIASKSGNILSVDFSGFDASVPPVLVRAAFELLRRMFTKGSDKLISYVEELFLTIPIATPDGIYHGFHGIPSGSGLTNWIGILIQMLLAEYTGMLIELAQGDDGVWRSLDPWNPDDIADTIKTFGMKLNVDKGLVSEDTVSFLQNIHMREYLIDELNVGVRPLERILNGMLSYEHMNSSWSSVDDTIRWIQQCQAGKRHPRFKILVEFLFKSDKLLKSGKSLKSLLESGGGIEKIASDLKQSSFSYGKEPLSKLEQFETVKELRSLGAFKRGASR